MKRPVNRHAAKGFSLVELVIVIVVVAGGAAAILSLNGTASRSTAVDQDIQIASQLAQECSEHIFALRRSTTYASIPVGTGNTTICPFPAIQGFSSPPATVDITSVTSGSLAACPNTCKTVLVKVSKGGQILAQTTFMLVNY